MPLIDKILLRKRTIIETIGDPLKNLCQIEHTRHRNQLSGQCDLGSDCLYVSGEEAFIESSP